MRRSRWLWFWGLGAYAFLYAPLAIVVGYSFNDSSMNAQWVGFTLDWYRKLFHNQDMLTSAWNSLVIGLTAIYAYLLVATVFILELVYSLLDPRVRAMRR